MRTTSKKFVEQVRNHIEEILSTDETEILAEQLENVDKAFNNWYGKYEQKRMPNRMEAFKDWLLGLPSEISIDCYYHDIHENLKTWFENCGAVYQERKNEPELYYHLIGREYHKMLDLSRR